MKFFCVKNLVSSEVFEQAPWDFKPNIPAIISSKELRQQWWKTPTTQHMFYNMFEGQMPKMRVCKTNPPVRMYGLVADYDTTITKEMYVSPSFDGVPVLPYAWSLTGSGRGRMVWVFERPLPLPDMTTVAQFMKIAAKQMSLKTIWAGFDEAFYRSTQYYEAGHDWYVPGKSLVPHNMVMAMMGQAWESRNKRVKLVLPLDQLYAELEKKFPGAWEGPFELKQRTKRFWDPEAKNPTAAILRPNGFQCFTGPKAFVSWEELLGAAFVRSAEAGKLQEGTEGIFFDGRNYFRKTDMDEWLIYNKDDIKTYLKVRLGISAKPASPDTPSDLERTMCFIQEGGRIEAALPFVQHKPGMAYMDGKRYLNTSTCNVMSPAAEDTRVTPKDFPWLSKYFETLFDNELQLPRFLAWLKRFYEAGYYYKPCSGQALFIAGETDRGKTLLADYIIAKMVGGFRDGSTYLMGEAGNFSAPFLEVPLLTVNDTTVSTDEQRHTRYSSILKKMVANKDFFYNQKYDKASSMKWLGRVVITCNNDPVSLGVLPNVEMSIMDKIMLFRASNAAKDFHPGFTEKIDQELPYFCRWLLNWKYPPEIMGSSRFGVESYHHPVLYRTAVQTGQSHAFVELLMLFLYSWSSKYTDIWVGTTAKLLTDMINDAETGPLAVKYTANKVGSLLGQLRSRGYRLINKHTRHGNVWEIPCDPDKILPSTSGRDSPEEEEIRFDPEELSRTSSIFQGAERVLSPAG